MHKIILSSIVVTLLNAGCTAPDNKPKNTSKEETKSPNVVLMIGDGMGVSQVTAATIWNPDASSFYRFRTVGLIETYSTSNKVTDSAAGATAFASGVVTYNRAIGVNPDSVSVPTILEELQAQGYQTGVISLTSITHATPACFYAHVSDRDMHEEIAAQLVTSEVDFFAGGGWQYFTQREDKRNLLQELTDKGYEIDTTDLPTKIEAGKRYGYLLDEKTMPSKVQGRGDFLQEATALALDYFSQSDQPYFLMVEGSYIDWGGHATDAQMVIKEAVDFDQTIDLVLDQADSSTLVVVTADHETGGVSIGKHYETHQNGSVGVDADSLAVEFKHDQHTATLVPVFAKGHQEELFAGVYSNNDIYHRLKKACGLN